MQQLMQDDFSFAEQLWVPAVAAPNPVEWCISAQTLEAVHCAWTTAFEALVRFRLVSSAGSVWLELREANLILQRHPDTACLAMEARARCSSLEAWWTFLPPSSSF